MEAQEGDWVTIILAEDLSKGGKKGRNPAPPCGLPLCCEASMKRLLPIPSDYPKMTPFSFPCLCLSFYLCHFKLLHISPALARVPCDAKKIGDYLQ